MRTILHHVFFVVFFFCADLKAEAQELTPRIAYRHRIDVSYYPVEGKNSNELNASMLERGPIGHEHKRFYAYTLWHMRIGRSRQQQSLEKINRTPDLLCKISVHMPYLRMDQSVSAELRRYWIKFVASMAAHESRHVKNAVRACNHLSIAKGNQASLDAASKRLKNRDSSYDLVTRHGFLEGVSLPLSK